MRLFDDGPSGNFGQIIQPISAGGGSSSAIAGVIAAAAIIAGLLFVIWAARKVAAYFDVERAADQFSKDWISAMHKSVTGAYDQQYMSEVLSGKRQVSDGEFTAIWEHNNPGKILPRSESSRGSHAAAR